MWIESHIELLGHYKTTHLMRLLHLNNRHTAVGLLHSFWWWCLVNAPDGNLTGIDPEDIARGCLWTEGGHILLLALKKAGFVDADDTVHDWAQYTGRLVDQRSRDAERKRQTYRRISGGDLRLSGGDLQNGDLSTELSTELSTANSLSNGRNSDMGSDVVQNDGELSTTVYPVSAGEKPRKLPNDDKLNTDNTLLDPIECTNTVEAEAAAAFEQFFTVFWRNYPARKGRKVGKATVRAWLRKNLKPGDYQPMLKAVRSYADNCGDYARDPIRFLKDDWWRDWLDFEEPSGPLDINKYKYGKYAHLFNHEDD